ncbi:MAG: hypothetical protein ACI8Z1_003252 [Candidatus Azotimanducaceae bacterium]|jgi:hypothetical protein
MDRFKNILTSVLRFGNEVSQENWLVLNFTPDRLPMPVYSNPLMQKVYPQNLAGDWASGFSNLKASI